MCVHVCHVFCLWFVIAMLDCVCVCVALCCEWFVREYMFGVAHVMCVCLFGVLVFVVSVVVCLFLCVVFVCVAMCV